MEFKKIKEMSLEEIKQQSIIIDASLSKRLNKKDPSKNTCVVNFKVIPGVIEKTIYLSLSEYINVKLSYKSPLEYNTSNIKAYARLSRGFRKSDGSEFNLVEVVFNKNVVKSFFLDDLDIDNIKALGRDLKFIDRPDLNDDDVISNVVIPGYEEN